MNKIKISITQELTPQEINDLVSCALEGGINYWCGLAEKKENPDGTWFGVALYNMDKIKYASDLIAYNGVLILHDAESDDKWELTLENMIKGIQMHCEKRGITPKELVDDYDADDADAIVQYAVMNEITFG